MRNAPVNERRRPGAEVDVLYHHIRTGAEAVYLARFQHGWVWVSSKIDVGRSTPLSWKFATEAELDGDPTEVRTLNDAGHVDWLAS